MGPLGIDPGAGGHAWPALPVRRRSRSTAIAVHVVGALAYVAALGFGLVASVILEFMSSYSGEAPSAGQRYGLFFGLTVVSAIVTAVPAFTGVIARQMKTAAIPWFVVAALTAVETLAFTLNSHPLPGGTTLHF